MRTRILQVTTMIVLSLVLAACAAQSTDSIAQPPVNAYGSQPTQGETARSISTPSTSNVEVTIKNFGFTPDTLTVKVGTTITWTNQDSVTHTVTSDTDVFDSGGLGKGESFSFTFTAAGSYPYHCTPHHAQMSGTIIVTD